jgi:hypothetical protein
MCADDLWSGMGPDHVLWEVSGELVGVTSSAGVRNSSGDVVLQHHVCAG